MSNMLTGRYVRVRTADHFVLAEPLLAERPEQPQRRHRLFTVEYVVDDALEVEAANSI